MNKPEDDLCQARIAFHGRIVADSTHEIQNHFAVIKEYNGLIGDLLNSKQPDIGDRVKRCRDISGSINERARMAAEMVETLNRFTHRGDAAVSDFRVEEVVEDLVSLMQRSAGRRRIALEASHGRKLPVVTSDPSMLQFLIFSLASPLIDNLPEKEKIGISTDRGKGNTPTITIIPGTASRDLLETGLMDPGLMDACITRLEATFSLDDGGKKGRRLMLSIPSIA